MSKGREQLYRLAKKFNYTCFYCRKKFKIHELSREHLIPKSKGGGSGRNIVLACKMCNQARGNMPRRVFNKLK